MTEKIVSRHEIIAKFLKGDRHRLLLALEVEKAVRDIREQTWQELREEVERFGNARAWKFTPKKQKGGDGFLFQKDSGWSNNLSWNGIWIWRDIPISRSCYVAVEGWKNRSDDFKKNILEEGSRFIGDHAGWRLHDEKDTLLVWSVENYLLENGVSEVKDLVSRLMDFADERTITCETSTEEKQGTETRLDAPGSPA